MTKQELIDKLRALRDVEIWAVRNFKREDFVDEKSFLKGLEKYRKQAEYYSTAMKFAEQLDEPKECEFIIDEYGYCCSDCGFSEVDCVELYKEQVLDFNYCPSCGAKIKREVKDVKN